jgi:hypothetical protein
VQKASAAGIADFRLRILGGFPIRIPQSTIRNFEGPPHPESVARLMVFASAALASGPGNA